MAIKPTQDTHPNLYRLGWLAHNQAELHEAMDAYVATAEGELAYGSETALLGYYRALCDHTPDDVEWWVTAYRSLHEYLQLDPDVQAAYFDDFLDSGVHDGAARPDCLDDPDLLTAEAIARGHIGDYDVTIDEAIQAARSSGLDRLAAELAELGPPGLRGPWDVVLTRFHGGGTVESYQHPIRALVEARETSDDDCECGCCQVVHRDTPLPGVEANDDNGYSPYTVCR